MLRIIGGEYRSRQIASPEGTDVTRPIAARVKESLFNLLRGWVEDANVLDLFAGVGTIGLEAVSRGAKRVVMVEHNRRIFRMLEENIETLDCSDRAEAMHGDALSAIIAVRAPKPVDLLFIDPPYSFLRDEAKRQQVLSQIETLRPVLADRSFVMLRTPEIAREMDLSIGGYEGPEIHRYGTDMRVNLYMPAVA